MISVFFSGLQVLGASIAVINPLLARSSTAAGENTNEIIWQVGTGG